MDGQRTNQHFDGPTHDDQHKGYEDIQRAESQELMDKVHHDEADALGMLAEKQHQRDEEFKKNMEAKTQEEGENN